MSCSAKVLCWCGKVLEETSVQCNTVTIQYRYFYPIFLIIGLLSDSIQGSLQRQGVLNPQKDFYNCRKIPFFMDICSLISWLFCTCFSVGKLDLPWTSHIQIIDMSPVNHGDSSSCMYIFSEVCVDPVVFKAIFNRLLDIYDHLK